VEGWTALLGAIAAVCSAATAAIAIWLAVQSNRRAWEFARAQMYLRLRSRFLDILPNLGDLSAKSDPTSSESMARIAYWHHAYDEWRLSSLAPKQFGHLWDEQFKKAVISGYAHPALRNTFDELRSDAKGGFGLYARDFINEVLKDLPEPVQDSGSGPSDTSP
jgi:hypothetical protein